MAVLPDWQIERDVKIEPFAKAASRPGIISYGVTSDLIRGDVFYWGSLMSGALIGAVPVAVIYAFSLDHFIHGLTAGALK